MTPIQYLIYIRIEKAKELAVQEGLTPSEIAHRVGYSDVHTFGNMFKKKTGISISAFCELLFTDNINLYKDSFHSDMPNNPRVN